MEQIRKQARSARRRLTVERFLGYLPWTLSAAIGVALIGLVLPKLMHLPVDQTIWFSSWVGGCALVGLIINSCLTFMGGATTADAAVEIDKRFGLRERLSSALVLTPEDRETELGEALASDANRRAEKIDVRDQFSWGFRRSLLVPILPAMLAAALWWVPNRAEPEQVASKKSLSVQQVKNSTKPLMAQIKKKRAEAEKKGLTAAVDMFKKLEGELAKLQKDTKLDTKQTLAKLNDIKNQLSERKKELGGADSLRKNLKSMEKFEAGPAQKLADALKQGDFMKAEESLGELLKKMENGSMSQADMQKLQKQLEKLQNAMAEAAQQHEQAKQALQQQIAQAEAAGDMQKAAQLQRKLEQAQANDANASQMQQMASMLEQAQQAMQEGDMQSAQDSLQQMASQIAQMNQADAQLQDLDELMDSLAQSKSSMMGSMMGSMPGEIPGQGMGEGQGQGERPEAESDAQFWDTRVRQKMQMGETVYGGKVGGDNRKGTTMVEVQEMVLTSITEDPEALDDTPLPKNQRDHTRGYFDSIREGN